MENFKYLMLPGYYPVINLGAFLFADNVTIVKLHKHLSVLSSLSPLYSFKFFYFCLEIMPLHSAKQI